MKDMKTLSHQRQVQQGKNSSGVSYLGHDATKCQIKSNVVGGGGGGVMEDLYVVYMGSKITG